MRLSIWSRVTQLKNEMLWDSSIFLPKEDWNNATLDIYIYNTRLFLPESWDIHTIFLTLLFFEMYERVWSNEKSLGKIPSSAI